MTDSIHGLPINELDLLVKRIAHSVPKISHSVDFEDLCTIGMVAALEAATRYDASKGAKFSTYVWQNVRGDMLRANREYARAGKAVSTREDRKAWAGNTAKIVPDFRLDAPSALTDTDRDRYERIMIDSTDPADAVMADELRDGFQAYLSTLSGTRRYVLTCLVCGWTYAEIAESLWSARSKSWGVSKQWVGQIVAGIYKDARKNAALKGLLA